MNKANMTAWKISYDYGLFKLFHCPFSDKQLTVEEAKTAQYHI